MIDRAELETQPDGYKLFVRRYGADSPRGLVQLFHGMGEHSGRYLPVIKALGEAGYLCVMHDHRSMGRSAAPNDVPLGAMQDKAGWPKMKEDALQLAQDLKAQYPGLPLALIGHSLGSFLVQDIMTSPEASRYDAFVLSGTNGRPSAKSQLGKPIILLQRALQGRYAPATWIHRISFDEFNRPFKPIRTDQDWLSRDPANADAFISDPLCGPIFTTESWWQLAGVFGHLAQQKVIDQLITDRPIWLFSGSEDSLNEGGKGLERLADSWRAVGAKDLSLTIYPGARHECFNETNRDEVIADLLTWLAAKLA